MSLFVVIPTENPTIFRSLENYKTVFQTNMKDLACVFISGHEVIVEAEHVVRDPVTV